MLLIMLCACDDSDPKESAADAGSRSDAMSGAERVDAAAREDAANPDAASAPLYAVSTTIFGPTSDTSFVFVVPGLGADSTRLVDPASVPELTPGSRAYGPAKAGIVYLTSGEDGTMTELLIAEDGEQTTGRVLSFANLGINETSGGNVNVFISDTKAYHVNQMALTVVVWNPEEMTITKTVPLGISVADGFDFRAFGHIPLVVDGKLVLTSNSWKYGSDGAADDLTVVVVDTESDEVVSTEREMRCTGAFQWARGADGHAYFASNSSLASIYHATPELAREPCALRMKAGTTSFDPDYMRNIEEEVGSPLWGGFVRGPGDEMLTRVAQLSHPAIEAAEAADEYGEADAWEWWAIRPDAPEARRLEDLGTGAGATQAYAVEDKSYVVTYNSDNGQTTLLDTSTSELEPGLSVPGYVYNVIRVR